MDCIINILKKDAKQATLSSTEIGYIYCNKLFEYERGMKDMEPDERKSAGWKRKSRFWTSIGNGLVP